jgi:hypothetical protein
MSPFNLFHKKQPALLTVRVNADELCVVRTDELPCEKQASVVIEADSSVSFIDAEGAVHTHALGAARGWAHFSVRVHANKGCQVDCVIGDSPTFDPDALRRGDATGIRFQPFFLPGAGVSQSELVGKGLFHRGLHFSGQITPGNVLLSCECDFCHRSFLIRSYHAGFSQAAYFYSASGKYTLTVSTQVPGSPEALSTPDAQALATLEQTLPTAPDGSRFGYLNPFRCPYCAAPYIDFAAHPGLREREYYGNYFPECLLRYEPIAD